MYYFLWQTWELSRLDDASLAHLVSLLPPRGVLVLEDIDCAFPSRVDGDEDEFKAKQSLPFNVSRTSQVTMSGLLNILDGVGSGDHPSHRYSRWIQG
jgi:mitochondrial chaperone BCS1